MTGSLSGILGKSPGVPPLFESEDIAVRALAHQLSSVLEVRGTPGEIADVARQIVRNVASMVLEDWIE